MLSLRLLLVLVAVPGLSLGQDVRVRVSSGAELLPAILSEGPGVNIIELPSSVTVTSADWPFLAPVNLSRNVLIQPAPELLALGMKAVLDLSMLPNRLRIMPGVEFTLVNLTLRNIHMPLGKTAQFFSYSPGGRLVFRDTTSSRAVGLDVTTAAVYSRTLPRPASDPGNQTVDIYSPGRYCFKLDASAAPVAPPGSAPYNTSAAPAGTGLRPVTVCVGRVVSMSVDVVADVGVDNSAETVGVLYGGYTQVARNHAYWTETDPDPACITAKPIAVCVSERAAQLEAASAAAAAALAAKAAESSDSSSGGLSDTEKIVVGVVVGVGGALILAAIVAAVLYGRRRRGRGDRSSGLGGASTGASWPGDVECNGNGNGKFVTTSTNTAGTGTGACSGSSSGLGGGGGGGDSGSGTGNGDAAAVAAGSKGVAAGSGAAPVAVVVGGGTEGGGVAGAAELLFHGLGDGQVAEWQPMRIPKSADPQATSSIAATVPAAATSIASTLGTTGGFVPADQSAASMAQSAAAATGDAAVMQMPETIITLNVGEAALAAALVALGGEKKPEQEQQSQDEGGVAAPDGAAAADEGRGEGGNDSRALKALRDQVRAEGTEEARQDEERNAFLDASSTSDHTAAVGGGSGTANVDAVGQQHQEQARPPQGGKAGSPSAVAAGGAAGVDAAGAAGAAVGVAGRVLAEPELRSAALDSSSGAMQLMSSSDADCTTGTNSTHAASAAAAAAARLRDSLATELETMKQRHSTVKDVQLKITGVLGAGAYGTVYRGEWQGLQCAVKVVVFNGNHESRKVALREAALCQSINHPNVAATYLVDLQPLVAVGDASAAASSGAAAGVATALGSQEAGRLLQQAASRLMDFRLYIIQEFCDAGPLRALIAARGLLYPAPTAADAVDANGLPPPARVRLPALYELALGIARALAHLHSKSIVHSDLTPNNILLKRDPIARCGLSAKVADFGLSIIVPDSRTHLSNHRCGSPFYIAPEVYSHGQACTASDIFSLGVVLWELYMNTSAGQRDLATGRLQYNPAFPELPTACPSGLRWLVQACLQKEVARRPNAGRVIAALAQLLAECTQQQQQQL